MRSASSHLKEALLIAAKQSFHFRCDPFPSVISNDCFGGEIYRALGLPYNTPFVGLMVMAPCYLRMLSRLGFYLSQPLRFTDDSRYPAVNELRAKKRFPVAILGGDVEIHFLHYDSPEQSAATWVRRVTRVDFDNLLVKFDFSKDYAQPAHLREFLALGFERKLAIGSTRASTLRFSGCVADLPVYDTDATVLFRKSLEFVDYRALFCRNVLEQPPPIVGRFRRFFLVNEWGRGRNAYVAMSHEPVRR